MRAPLFPNDEERVILAFVAFLEAEGWSIVRARPAANEPDVVATRGNERLIAEAKGRTTAPRTDIDTMFGQLLRRIELDSSTTYAAVVPSAFVSRALDVSGAVRSALRLQLFEVTDDGRVLRR